MKLDHSVYPDLEFPPLVLETKYDKADYLHRICTSWDFGIHPEQFTFDLFATWRDIFDEFPVVTSPGYHAFRLLFCWAPVKIPPGLSAPTLQWEHLDRLEGRPPDPCENLI